MKRRLFIALPFLATAAKAHSLAVGDLKIGHAWAKPAEAGKDGMCFMPLLNSGADIEKLVSARSDVCLFVEMRQSADYETPPEQALELSPGAPLAMRPNAIHLRLHSLKQDLPLGSKFKLVLDFLNAGEIELQIHVEETPGA